MQFLFHPRTILLLMYFIDSQGGAGSDGTIDAPGRLCGRLHRGTFGVSHPIGDDGTTEGAEKARP